MAYIVMACIAMACIAMACIVMAYIVMAYNAFVMRFDVFGSQKQSDPSALVAAMNLSSTDRHNCTYV